MVETADRCLLKKGYNYGVNAWWRPQIGVCLKGYNYSVNAWWRQQIGVCLRLFWDKKKVVNCRNIIN